MFLRSLDTQPRFSCSNISSSGHLTCPGNPDGLTAAGQGLPQVMLKPQRLWLPKWHKSSVFKHENPALSCYVNIINVSSSDWVPSKLFLYTNITKKKGIQGWHGYTDVFPHKSWKYWPCIVIWDTTDWLNYLQQPEPSTLMVHWFIYMPKLCSVTVKRKRIF